MVAVVYLRESVFAQMATVDVAVKFVRLYILIITFML